MKKIILILILMVLVSGCTNIPCESTTNEETFNIIKGPTEPFSKYKGLWLPFLRETEIAADNIKNLKDNGINVVAIGVRLFASDEEHAWVVSNITEYENQTKILEAINTFHENGIKTIIILNPAHGDFGISPHPAEYTGKPLLKMHEQLIIKWANISEQYGVDMFCPINEPNLLASKEDISGWAQEILTEIKNVYHGKVAFRIQNEGEDYPVYDLEGYDYILPSATHCSKDVDRGGGYFDSMRNNNIDKIAKIKERYSGYKYVFFEVGGYTGPDYYWWEPIAPANMKNNNWNLDEDFAVVSPEGQATCFELFFNLGWNTTDGYLINTAKGFEFQGKPAELIIRKWYAEVSS